MVLLVKAFLSLEKMDVDDKRSQLIWSYAKVIEFTRPRAFIMENVKALGTLKKWEK